MDAKRLTPYLRRRVLELCTLDRLVLQRELANSLKVDYVAPTQRLGLLGDAMRDLSGYDIRARIRTREVVTAREVFVFVARLEGITQDAIAKYLKRDHATISYCEARMREALIYPRICPEKIELYNKFTQKILK